MVSLISFKIFLDNFTHYLLLSWLNFIFDFISENVCLYNLKRAGQRKLWLRLPCQTSYNRPEVCNQSHRKLKLINSSARGRNPQEDTARVHHPVFQLLPIGCWQTLHRSWVCRTWNFRILLRKWGKKHSAAHHLESDKAHCICTKLSSQPQGKKTIEMFITTFIF